MKVFMCVVGSLGRAWSWEKWLGQDWLGKQPIQGKPFAFFKIILKVHIDRALKFPHGAGFDVCFLWCLKNVWPRILQIQIIYLWIEGKSILPDKTTSIRSPSWISLAVFTSWRMFSEVGSWRKSRILSYIP